MSVSLTAFSLNPDNADAIAHSTEQCCVLNAFRFNALLVVTISCLLALSYRKHKFTGNSASTLRFAAHTIFQLLSLPCRSSIIPGRRNLEPNLISIVRSTQKQQCPCVDLLDIASLFTTLFFSLQKCAESNEPLLLPISPTLCALTSAKNPHFRTTLPFPERRPPGISQENFGAGESVDSDARAVPAAAKYAPALLPERKGKNRGATSH